MKKWLIAVIAIGIIVLSVGAGYAAKSYGARTRNTISTGVIDIDLKEKRTDGSDFTDLVGVLPASAHEKRVSVVNSGDEAAWVRVKLEKSVTLAPGKTGTPDPSLVSLDIDTASWEYKSGYYYYTPALTGGSETTPLFTSVSFSPAMDAGYSGCSVQIKVTAEAVQYRSNESGGCVDAFGRLS